MNPSNDSVGGSDGRDYVSGDALGRAVRAGVNFEDARAKVGGGRVI